MGFTRSGTDLPDHEKLPVLTAQIDGMRIRYTLSSAVVQGITFYGIEVVLFSGDGREEDRVFLPEICSDYDFAVRIIETMCQYAVTPCTAGNVADDMLAESVIISI